MAHWKDSFVISKAVNVAFDIEYFQINGQFTSRVYNKEPMQIERTPRVLMLVAFDSSAVPCARGCNLKEYIYEDK